VEKPLALILEDAEKVAAAVAQGDTLLTVGFNRRFAPTVVALREAISSVTGPRQFLYRINAPLLPAGHWTADPVEGGGRLIGEGCHFIDLVCHLADSEVASVSGGFLGSCGPSAAQDNFSAVLRFQNGDLATVVYSGQGNPALPKERLEAFAGGKAFVLDDFLRLSAYGIRLTSSPPERPDKGFHQHLAHFFAAVRGEGSLVTTAQDWLRVARVIEALLNPGLPQ
jgi:predicted dehydrogenase